MKIKKINPIAFSKFQATFGLLIGLNHGTILAFGVLLGMPLIFAGFAAIIGFFEGLIYNQIIAKFFCYMKISSYMIKTSYLNSKNIRISI